MPQFRLESFFWILPLSPNNLINKIADKTGAMSALRTIFRWKTLSALLLIAGLGLAVHAAPVLEQQSPCEPGLFAQVQTAVVPAAWADVEEGCDNFCSGTGCYGLPKNCRSCYDGKWTFCYEYREGEEPPSL
jgi:hypothetical protein